MIVWVEMLPEDGEADVEALAWQMADARISWYHDPKQRAGKAVAASLGAPGNIAWDVYLFFDTREEWEGQPPVPTDWVHQLSDPWADPTRHHFGDRLEPELGRLLKSLLGR